MAEETWFQGVAASPGIAVATACRFEPDEIEVEEKALAAADVAAEVDRFRRAMGEARTELVALRQATAEMIGEEQAAIFDAHLSMLDDPMGLDETIRDIGTERKNAAWLYRRNMRRIAETLEQNGDDYFSERAQDIRDVKRRVLRRILDTGTARTPCAAGTGVLVAHELSPSEAAQLSPAHCLGLAVNIGGRTSHAAIMARSRGIPAVVGLKILHAAVRVGDTLIVDGSAGRVVVNPRPDTLAEYRHRADRYRETQESWKELEKLPAMTRDGRSITLAANVELPEEADFVISRGAMGIGLFRTEFFLMRYHRFPPEEVQYTAYRAVVEKMAPHPVIIRTLDVGGDKFASYLGTASEDNPFLGMRGIRFLNDHRELFHGQIRAAYRASAHGRVKILLPMVSGLEEIRAARGLCRQVMEELSVAGIPFDPGVELGIMIEVPSAVVLADLMAREADFFSIGSNDLIQYTLAVDRGSASVAHLYEPLHPAVLRSIHQVVQAAHACGRWVGLCGEMGGDPTAVVLLVGLGLDEFSVGASMLPEVKRIIREIDAGEARGWAARVLELSTATEVRAFMEPILLRLFPDLNGQVRLPAGRTVPTP